MMSNSDGAAGTVGESSLGNGCGGNTSGKILFNAKDEVRTCTESPVYVCFHYLYPYFMSFTFYHYYVATEAAGNQSTINLTLFFSPQDNSTLSCPACSALIIVLLSFSDLHSFQHI